MNVELVFSVVKVVLVDLMEVENVLDEDGPLEDMEFEDVDVATLVDVEVEVDVDVAALVDVEVEVCLYSCFLSSRSCMSSSWRSNSWRCRMCWTRTSLPRTWRSSLGRSFVEVVLVEVVELVDVLVEDVEVQLVFYCRGPTHGGVGRG